MEETSVDVSSPQLEEKTTLEKLDSTENQYHILSSLDIYPEPSNSFTQINQEPASWAENDDASVASSHDVASLENMIIQFCIEYLPMKKSYCAQCRDYIELAQKEIKKSNYGCAIARYKSFLTFVDNFAVSKNKVDFSTGRVIELKSLANERISLCYLLKDSSRQALKFAHEAIIQKPVVAQSHLWRAIANRRLNNLTSCLKSLTIFGALSSVSLEECAYHFEEQKMISVYWKFILAMLQQNRSDLKLLHFPSFNLVHFSPTEQEERMSITLLMNYPMYNSLIHADPSSSHLLPVGDGGFAECLQEQKQAYGFKYNQEDSRYFAHLPKASYFNTSIDDGEQMFSSDVAKQLRETSAFINSTGSQMSLKPGRGLYEQLMYCHLLLKEEKYDVVIPEYESILVDLALFPVLSQEEWTDELALIIDANIEMVENAIEALKEHEIKKLNELREIEKIRQRLEMSERKFRVKQLLFAEAQWQAAEAICRRSSTTRRKPRTTKSSTESKTYRNLFPDN